MARTTWCVRCGKLADSGDYCDPCESGYQQEQIEQYDAGEPYPVSVGNAFGGPVCIMVSKDPKRCGCRGGGWCHTDLDSMHKCPEHYVNQTNPEYY